MNGIIRIKDGVLVSYSGPRGDLVLPDGIVEIGRAAACHTGLVRVTVPGSVSKIRAYAFAGCNHLKRAVIPEGVTAIGAGAFRDCNELTRVFLPESVTAIGDDAFACCPNLVIHAPAGSYAERYARKAGIPVRTRKAKRSASVSRARGACRAAA